MSATGSGGPGPGPGPVPGAGASNPRKFSEKIALHTQRQAEETAAFQEVMMDISSTRLQAQKLRLARTQGPYYGGSLPNVNQIGRSPQDFQGFPSGLESSRSTRHHGLVERVQRDRRFLSPARPYRNRPTDGALYSPAYLSPPPDASWRRTNSDSALHTSVMNPPSDAFGLGGPGLAPQGSGRHSGQSDGEARRMFPYPVPPIEENVLDEDRLKPWDAKKLPLLTARPKSCEVPGINIFTSPEQPSPPPHGVPSALSTGGSLPDLSSLHFPPPLPTPLDQDEPGFPGSSLSGGSSTGNLASTLTHLGLASTPGGGGFHQPSPGLLASLQSALSNPSLPSSLSNPNIQSSLSSHSFSNSRSSASLHSSLSNPSLQSSLSSSPSSLSSQSLLSSLSSSSLQSAPGSYGVGGAGSGSAPYPAALSTSPRRRAQLSPLILPMGAEPRRHHSKQFSPTISPTLSSITQGVPLDTSKLPLDQRLPPYPLSQSHQHQQGPQPGQQNHPGGHQQNHPGGHQQNHPGGHQQNHPGGHQQNHPGGHQQNHPGGHQTHPGGHQTHPGGHQQPRPNAQQQQNLQNLRNQHMQQHFGARPVRPPSRAEGPPEQTPPLCPPKPEEHISLSSDFYNDAFFNSLLDDPYLSLHLTGKSSQEFSGDQQSDGLNQHPPDGSGPPGPPGDQQLLNSQNQNYQNYGGGGHGVPNIILTGDSPPGLSKEIASALSHVPGFEVEGFGLEEPLDPLTLDLLQGPLLLPDPAVEEAFRQ